MSKYEGKISLRDVFGNHLLDLANKNEKIVMVNADLVGSSRTKTFVEAFPERYFNVGIAEGNMISFAAGLAHEGFMPFTYTFAPFMSMRACEQVRTDVAYGNCDVRMCAIYGGYSGGISGATHWGLEDVGILTAMDNIAVLEASDPYQAEKMMDYSLQHKGPIYFRSGVTPVQVLYDENYNFEFGKATIVKPGNDGAFIVSGPIVQYAKKASEEIEEETGKKIRVLDMHTIKPLDEQAVLDAAKTGNIVVAQDHNIMGGLQSHVATTLAKNSIGINFKMLGCSDKFESMAHDTYLYSKFEYDTAGLKKNMIELISKAN